MRLMMDLMALVMRSQQMNFTLGLVAIALKAKEHMITIGLRQLKFHLHGVLIKIINRLVIDGPNDVTLLNEP